MSAKSRNNAENKPAMFHISALLGAPRERPAALSRREGNPNLLSFLKTNKADKESVKGSVGDDIALRSAEAKR